jgi:4-diphosphocytidyl-2-C-methyl-D-erythritol kinase
VTRDVAPALAPAKVNLFLHVGAPEPSGYHPLCSLMAFADLGDRLTVAVDEPLALDVDGPFAAALAGEGDNLVMRAARALLEESGSPRSARLSLNKQLPVASGLGGGSSDAGAALRLLREALNLRVDDRRLEAIAASLGADGAACLWARPVLAEGYGERLSPAPRLPALAAVLVNPGVAVSTPEVYRAFDRRGVFGAVTPPPMPAAFDTAAELAGWLGLQRNDLEAPAIAVAPAVGAALGALAAQPEARLARVSGSGGTCFALCDDEPAADRLAGRLAAMEPRWWVRRCRLGGPWAAPSSNA